MTKQQKIKALKKSAMCNKQRILAFLKIVKKASKVDIKAATDVYESGEYIRRLRNDGYKIVTDEARGYTKSGRPVKFGIYVYMGMRK